MAQGDYLIQNQSFPSFRSDLNSTLEAINTSNSGTSRPTSAVAGTVWLDTTNATNPTLKFFDGTDDISLAQLDYSANTVNWLDSTVTISPLTTDLDVGGNAIISSSNGNITFTPDGTGKVIISGLSFPTSDGTCGQAIVTDGCGNLSFASVEGRTGTVDWDTTAKTASFTAVSGNGYFVNTTSGAITLTLPATPSAGDIVAFKDYAGTFGTNNLTVARNGSNLDGSAVDSVRNTNNESLSLVYVDGTQGWKSVEEGTGFIGENFIVATGGTVTCCGDYKIHTFTGPGTFTVSSLASSPTNNSVDYLVIAGGGGGGIGFSSGYDGGGGGAGGYRESSGAASGCYSVSPLGACVSALPVTAQGYPIAVGAGGSGRTGCSGCCTGPNVAAGDNGSNSSFSTITSTGGGGGGGGSRTCASNAQPGGSGGGGGVDGTYPSPASSGGTGNTPPVSPPQGNNGGNGPGVANNAGGGGGGATAVGANFAPNCGGAGGAGATSSINGTPTARAGGGGGSSASTPSPGGTGGGGAGASNSPANNGGNGTTNTGSGGGGGTKYSTGTGGSGGSGIVIIRYKYQ